MDSHYDSYRYSEFWIGRDYEDKAERLALKKFFSKIDSKNYILDIGGGYGRLANLYAPLFSKCLIVDPSETLLNEAKKNLKNYKNIDFKVTSSENLPKDNFNVALMVRVAHHIPEFSTTFKEVYAALKPRGYFILEFANKVHFLSRLKNLLKGNLGRANNLETVDVRSNQAKKEGKIIFVNHHPRKVEALLQQSGFIIVDRLSVSNLRHPLIKKIVPISILLLLENLFQKPLANLNFGPSIFLLCQKM